MKPVTTLAALFLHDDWARERLLDAAEPLSAEALDRAFPMGKVSLRNTLEHLWRAEFYWLDRWERPDQAPAARPAPGLPLPDLRRRFRETARRRDEFLDRAGRAGESKRIAFLDQAGGRKTYPLGDMMLHVCNHGFHHRAQALNMLRRVGGTAPDLDILKMRTQPSPHPPTEYDRDTIAEYYRYNDWARGVVHALAEGLSDADLDRPFEMGRGSLRRTLLHIRDAEQWWLGTWCGEPPDAFKRLPETASIAELDAALVGIAARRREYLSDSTAGDLERVVRVRPPRGGELAFTIGDTVLQLCGHGTHHRAQAVNMLRQVGATMPDIDYIDWVAFEQVAAS